MNRTVGWWPAILLALALACIGAAPSATSYFGVEQTIAKLQAAWAEEGARPQPHAPGWNAFFDGLRAAFQSYSNAKTEVEQLRALDRLYRFSVALRNIPWTPAVEIREGLRAWLRPRVKLAWAQRTLVDSVRRLPPTDSKDVRANRDRWVHFASEDLGSAMRACEAASTVAEHQLALKRIHAALKSLEDGNKAYPWSPAAAIEEALDDLFNRSNIDVTADVATVRPAFEANIVQPGPIFFRGQWSYITPGPKTGFGLVFSDNGIAFDNSQRMTSETHVRGFQEQMQKDPRAQKVTKLYHFDATTRDNSELTVHTVIRDDGLHITPSYKHNVDAEIAAAPIPGKELGRFIASLLGFNQSKIERKVYEGAIPRIRSDVADGAMELGTIRTREAAEQRNVEIRKYLLGHGTAKFQDFAVDGLELRSRPSYLEVAGKLVWEGDFPQAGADRPKPQALKVVAPGIGADIHLPSVLTNLSVGYFQSDYAQSLENIMIETRKIEPGMRPREAVELSENVGFRTYAQAVARAKALNDPQVMAIRIKKPDRAPEFAADARGAIAILLHDFLLEVPAPAQAARGGAVSGPPADIYRLSAPNAEAVITFRFVPGDDKIPHKVIARLEAFNAGPDAKVFAITEDEAGAKALTTFSSALVYRLMALRIQGQQFTVPLDLLPIKGLDLVSIAPIDPSGWTRAVLKRNGDKIAVRKPQSADSTGSTETSH